MFQIICLNKICTNNLSRAWTNLLNHWNKPVKGQPYCSHRAIALLTSSANLCCRNVILLLSFTPFQSLSQLSEEKKLKIRDIFYQKWHNSSGFFFITYNKNIQYSATGQRTANAVCVSKQFWSNSLIVYAARDDILILS